MTAPVCRAMTSLRKLAPVALALAMASLATCSTPNRMTNEGDDGGVEATACRERVDASLEAIESVRLEHLACESASDCALFDPSTQCLGGCPLAVAASGLDAMHAVVDELNAGVCDDFTADGCPFATPDCLQVFADCVDNLCETTTEDPGAP